MLNGIEIRALHWPWQSPAVPVFQQIKHRTSSMAGGIVMMEAHVRMQEGYHMREEDVFPETHSVEMACNDNKLSPTHRSRRTLHLQNDPEFYCCCLWVQAAM